MYLIQIEAKESGIDGKGVFALEKIKKGTIAWKYNSSYDKTVSIEQYNNSSPEVKEELDRVAYLSPTTNQYVYPPEGDPARFTNHSKQNNLTVVVNYEISDEPYFVANRDIDTGEELTNNYLEFDEALKIKRPEWI